METLPQRTLIEGPNEIRRAETAYRIEPEPSGIDFGDILGALRRNIWLIIVTTAVTVGIAAYMVSQVRARYASTASVRLIDRTPGVDGVATEIPIGETDPFQSELLVLQGRNVQGKAVDEAGFRIFDAASDEPAGFLEDVQVTLPAEESGRVTLELGDDGIEYGTDSDRQNAAYGQRIALEGASFVVPATAKGMGTVILAIVPRNVAIDYLSGNVTPVILEGTGGISVSMTSYDPAVPAPGVNAVVKAYQQVNAELARQSISRRREFLEEQLRETDSLLMTAQAGLSGFRAREQAYSVVDRFTAEQGNLIQAEIQQAQLQADLRMFESALNRILAARNSGGQGNDLGAVMSLPGLGSDPVVGSLFSQLTSYRSEREGLVAGPWARAVTHPDVRRLDTLIASTEDQLLEAIRSHIVSVRAQIGALGALRGRAAAKMSELPRTEVEEMYLSQNVSALQQTGDQLREQYQAVRLEEAAEAGSVEIVQLAAQSVPVPVSPWNKLFLGLLAGLMLGSGIALIRERMDQSFNRPEEIEEVLLIPNLGVIPEAAPYLLEPGTNGDGNRSPLDPPGAEAYRILRANLLFSQGELKSLVVTSATPGEGKTTTAANLAAAIARQGMRVLLMECDLRRPSLSRFFARQDGGVDLGDVLLENRPWREAIYASGVPGLDLLLASQTVPRAAEYLAGADMKGLLDELKEQYDMVILDTSPLLVAADAAVLGAIADGVLLVVRATHTDRDVVQRAMHQLLLVGARVVGTVLNDPDGSMTRYKSYYDYSAEYETT